MKGMWMGMGEMGVKGKVNELIEFKRVREEREHGHALNIHFFLPVFIIYGSGLHFFLPAYLFS